MNKKVSILTPCYNSEKYIDDFIKSILIQDYSPMELIMVDDGSVDKTAEKIKSYEKALKEKGIELKYFYKENGGAASAVAVGLKYVSGEYLIWPDSDDFLLKDSIKIRAAYMDSHPECNFLRCNGYVFDEANYEKPKTVISKLNRSTNLADFVNFIVPWCPGCYMVRMSAFDKANPGRKIYISKCGQNIQMMLPMAFKYPCEYLDKYVYGYVNHENSVSHSIRGYEQHIAKLSEYNEVVRQTFSLIPENTDKYFAMNCVFTLKQKLRIAWQYKKYDDLKYYFKEIKKDGKVDAEVLIMKTMPYNSFSKFLARCCAYVRNRISI